jgi:hypothetical protein
MPLSKGFLRKEPSFVDIPRYKLILGIVLGLFFSFSFYSFMYVFRETLRILSVTYTYDLWILTTKEVNFYNTIFACISAIIAQSVTITYWIDQPRRIFAKKTFRKTSIINDQRVFNWYFLSWFSKAAIAYGLIFGLTLKGGFYLFSFYPDYNFLFILIVIVLFSQTWLTLRIAFIKNGLKWMIYSILIIALIAFGLSRINLIDYEKINQNILQNNVFYQYGLDLPETDYFERLDRPSLQEDIYLVKPKPEQAKSVPLIIADNEIIELNQLQEKVKLWQSTRDYYDIDLMTYCLYIDKTIKMNFVYQLKNELAKSGVIKIAFAVVPAHPEFDKRFYQVLTFKMTLPLENMNQSQVFQINKVSERDQNIINIEKAQSGYAINNILVSPDHLKIILKRLILQTPDYHLKFRVNDTSPFSEYIRVISTIEDVINELRNEYSVINYSKQYNLLDYKELSEVIKKYPFRLVELTNDDGSN